jgi:hypothetical protein
MQPPRETGLILFRYQNEGDVYEDDYIEAFWGPNYANLLNVKNKYDPNGLLDCWQCGAFLLLSADDANILTRLIWLVGWKGAQSSRYSCYL